MKVLMITPWLPWPPFDGGRIRMLETLRYIAQRHEVTLLAHVHAEDELAHVEELRKICSSVETAFVSDRVPRRLARIASGMLTARSVLQSIHYSRALARRIAALTANADFDIVHVEFSFLARYTSAISARSRAKRILSTHNIESERFKREARLAPLGFRRFAVLVDSLFFPRWEAAAFRNFDAVSAVSEAEKAWIERACPTARVVLAPNGVDTAYFAKHPGGATASSVVFTGVMDYPPNVDAVYWFADRAWPLLHRRSPELKFVIVGSRPNEAVKALGEREGIEVTGEVPDIRPYVAAALAFVVPLRSGGGTRLKILQAMAMGCPVVSTAIGAEGIAVTPGTDILLAETPDELAERVLDLEQSPELARRVGDAGHRLVKEKYDWQRCLAPLESLYREWPADAR